MSKKSSLKSQLIATSAVAGFALVAFLIVSKSGFFSQSPQEMVQSESAWLTPEMLESASERDSETIVLAEKTTKFMDQIVRVMNEETTAEEVDFTEYFSEGAIERIFENDEVDRTGLQKLLDWETAIDYYELEEASFSPNPNTGVENTLAGVRAHLHFFDEQSMTIWLWEKTDGVWKVEGVMNMGH